MPGWYGSGGGGGSLLLFPMVVHKRRTPGSNSGRLLSVSQTLHRLLDGPQLVRQGRVTMWSGYILSAGALWREPSDNLLRYPDCSGAKHLNTSPVFQGGMPVMPARPLSASHPYYYASGPVVDLHQDLRDGGPRTRSGCLGGTPPPLLIKSCCAGRTRTYGLRVMNPASYHLLHRTAQMYEHQCVSYKSAQEATSALPVRS